MTYKKTPSQQYGRKPHGWVLGYTHRGKYRVFGAGSRHVPKGAEFISLVVPLDQKNVDVPIGCEVRRIGKENRLIVTVPRESIGMFEVEGLSTEEFLQPTTRRSRSRTITEYDRQISVIRKALKTLCPSYSVRRGTGTAYSWIDIQGSGEFGEFTDEERKALEKFGLNYGLNAAVISPESRKYYFEKALKTLEQS